MSYRTVLRYIELETGHFGDGPAWIARVRTSRVGGQMYFNRRAFLRLEGDRYVDIETYQVYRVEKVRDEDVARRRAGSTKVQIEKSAVEHYLRRAGAASLEAGRYAVIDDLPQTDIARFHTFAHRPSVMGTTSFPNTSSL